MATIVALPFAWLIAELSRRHADRKLVKELEAKGALVYFDNSPRLDDEWQSTADNALSYVATGDSPDGAVKGLHWYLASPEVDYSPLIRKSARRFPRLKELSLDGASIDDAMLSDIGRLTNLEFLSLNRTKVTDVGLHHFSKLSQLQLLHLDLTQVSDDGLAQLEGLPNLRDISLRGTRVTEPAVSKFRAAHPQAKIVWVSRLEEDAMAAVSALHERGWTTVLFANANDSTPQVRLIPIETQQPALNQTDRRRFMALPHFEAVIYHFCTDQTVEFLVGIEQMTHVSVHKVDDDRLRRICRATHLKELELRGDAVVSDEGLSNLRQLTSLERLAIWEASLSPKGIGHLASLESLKSLQLFICSFSAAEDLEPLRNLTALENLSLVQMPVSCESLTHLQALPRLRTLDLGFSTLDDSAAEILAGFQSLQELAVNNTRISDVGLLKLATISSLQLLECDDRAGVTPEGLERFHKLRPDVKLGFLP